MSVLTVGLLLVQESDRFIKESLGTQLGTPIFSCSTLQNSRYEVIILGQTIQYMQREPPGSTVLPSRVTSYPPHKNNCPIASLAKVTIVMKHLDCNWKLSLYEIGTRVFTNVNACSLPVSWYLKRKKKEETKKKRKH